jgi:hypothetical protein
MIKEAYDHPLHATRDLPRQSKPFRPHLKGRNNFLRYLLMYIVIWKKQIIQEKTPPSHFPGKILLSTRRRDAVATFSPDGGTPSLLPIPHAHFPREDCCVPPSCVYTIVIRVFQRRNTY